MTDISRQSPPGYGKAYAAGAASSASIILIWLWNTFVPAHQLPVEVSGALQALIVTLAVIYTPHGVQQ
jgi:hypothetical protein